MKRCIRILAEFYDPAHPFALALGGQATDSVDLSDVAPPFADLGAFSSVTSFDRALEEGFASSRSGAEEMVGGAA